MIEVNDISKSFGDVRAVDGVSFRVEKGEIYGFLGPNGAGKTTTISMISGLLEPDSGTISIGGEELTAKTTEVKRNLGVVPQEIALYDELSGRENLVFWGSLYGIPSAELRESAERVLDMVDLTGRADDQVRTYSGGMKRRINLGAGLIHDPDLILMDEPTLGIDPQARASMLDIVRKEAERGKTIIYTTHYLDEAQNLCDRIAIIDKGTVHAEGTLRQLTEMAGQEDLVTLTGDFEPSHARKLVSGLTIDHIEEGSVRFFVSDRERIGKVLNDFFDESLYVKEVSIKEPSLESVFLRLTGYELRD